MVRPSGGAGAAPKSEPAELEALAREALGQAPEAVERFLLAIAPTIRRACRGVLGARHPDLEDAIQDALIDATRALPMYRFQGSLAGYVTTIAVRRALMSRRSSAVRARHLQLLAEPPDHAPNAIANVNEAEQMEVVRALIRRLRPVQAETLVMRVILGMSVEEIALSTDVPVNTVKSRLRLAKGTLREFLTQQPGGDQEGQGS